MFGVQTIKRSSLIEKIIQMFDLIKANVQFCFTYYSLAEPFPALDRLYLFCFPTDRFFVCNLESLAFFLSISSILTEKEK